MQQICFQIYCYSCHCEKCCGCDLYVGKAKYGVEYRHKQHLSCAKRILEQGVRGIAIDHLIAIHGVDNIRVRTIATLPSLDELDSAEVRFIQELKTSHAYGGMNFHRGGRGGRLPGAWKPTSEQVEAARSQLIESYRRWREQHPEEARARGKRMSETRGEDWLQKLREGVKKVPHDVRVARTKAGWVTRRLRKAEKLKSDE